MVTLRVREIAERKGLTLSELQRRTLMNFPSLRRYWYGPNQQVSLDAMEKLAEVLEVDFCDLFKRTEE